jgi:succinoglycan biosynthesis protein ExoO
VSVLIATYNSALYVEAAVRSALGQTLAALEVIVVDDCSSDQTMAIIDGLAREDQRVRFDRLPCNRGPAGARNRAIEIAQGEWLAVLDSDDMFEPDRLKKLVAVAEREGADIIVDDLIMFDDEDPSAAAFFLGPHRTTAGWRTLSDYLRSTVMYGKSANLGYLKPVIRSERLRSAGIRYDERLRIAEDDDLIVRMLLGDLTYWLEPIPGYFYRRHPESISHRLGAADAMAIKDASDRLMTEVAKTLPDNVQSAFVARHTAIIRAYAFSSFIEALKARKPWQAAIITLKVPSLIGLLHMPIKAAFARARSRWLPPASKPVDPAAAAALERVSPTCFASK